MTSKIYTQVPICSNIFIPLFLCQPAFSLSSAQLYIQNLYSFQVIEYTYIDRSTNNTQNCTTEEVKQYISGFTDLWYQEETIRKIVNNCNRSAIPKLIQVLNLESDYRVRESASAALGYIGGPVATEALINTLSSDSSYIVRKKAADALGTIRDVTAISPLIETLENRNEDDSVRKSAASSLSDIGGTAAINALIRSLKNSNESLNLRQASAKALQQIGDASIDPLVANLQSPDLRTQYASVQALSKINSLISSKVLDERKDAVTQILEAAYKADIVEFDRVPASRAGKGSSGDMARRPVICGVSWIAQYWDRCR